MTRVHRREADGSRSASRPQRGGCPPRTIEILSLKPTRRSGHAGRRLCTTYHSCMVSRGKKSGPAAPGEWTFLTNHAHVLLCLATDPEVRLRDVAEAVGITERAAQRIVMELEGAGYLERERVGRRNRYRLHADQPLRHPMDRDHHVNELLAVLSPDRVARPGSGTPNRSTTQRTRGAGRKTSR